jgi:hypothetical protein
MALILVVLYCVNYTQNLGRMISHYSPGFNLVIRHVQAKLLHSALDGIPASQSRSKVNVPRHAEISRVDLT